jgi:hypothetical protein
MKVLTGRTASRHRMTGNCHGIQEPILDKTGWNSGKKVEQIRGLMGRNSDTRAVRSVGQNHRTVANCCHLRGARAMNPVHGSLPSLHCARTGWPVLQGRSVVAPPCWDGCHRNSYQGATQIAMRPVGRSATRILQAAVAQSLPLIHSRNRHETGSHLAEAPAKAASRAVAAIRPEAACPATVALRWIAPCPATLSRVTAAFRSWAGAGRCEPFEDCWSVQLLNHSPAAERCFGPAGQFL